MAYRDLREFLARLEAEQELVRVPREVDPQLELTAVIKALGEKAVLFEKVKGSPFPLVGNLWGNYRKVELTLEKPREQLLTTFLQRVQDRIPPVLVDAGPVQEHVLLGDDVDLTRLPIPTHNAGDGGPYIDCGIIVARDPEFGTNLSLQRLQLKGPRRTGIFMGDIHHMALYYRRAEELGRPLEIAVVIGCDPVLYVACQTMGAPEVDEYALAGALRGAPVEVVRCKTVDLEVPAWAEIVLEGRILPGVREEEGPFGEFPGYYGPRGLRPVVEYSAITYRSNPTYQTIYMRKPPTENSFLTAVPKAADIYRVVKECVAEVKDVYLPPGGCGKYHAVVSIKKRTEGEPKLALSAILSSRHAVKHAVVVDEDIDIYNPHDVEWAIATRSQFDVDSVVMSGLPGMLDPSTIKRGDGLIAKMGIDATRPLGVEYPQVCDVPDDLYRQVQQNLDQYLKR